MYVEERIYTLHPGKAAEYLKIYEGEGMAVQAKHLPNMVGYYFVEVGPQNTIVHLWAYESLDQREKLRAGLQADPAWQAYLAKGRALLISQETRILKCAPFFVERLKKMLAAAK
jgi:hypothetical protein